jgi:hypothetical protein
VFFHVQSGELLGYLSSRIGVWINARHGNKNLTFHEYLAGAQSSGIHTCWHGGLSYSQLCSISVRGTVAERTVPSFLKVTLAVISWAVSWRDCKGSITLSYCKIEFLIHFAAGANLWRAAAVLGLGMSMTLWMNLRSYYRCWCFTHSRKFLKDTYLCSLSSISYVHVVSLLTSFPHIIQHMELDGTMLELGYLAASATL